MIHFLAEHILDGGIVALLSAAALGAWVTVTGGRGG
jgi:hypothetical protein